MKPLGVEHVRAVLSRDGIEVLELPADTSTAVLAAQALNTTVPTIVKSLLFLADGEPLLVLVAGDRRVDARRLAGEAGTRKVRMARPDECIEIAGHAVGGVPPLGHRRPIRTLLDRHLLDHETVYAAAGAGNAIFAVEPRRLLAMTAAEITDAAQ
jgi:prolyl-tRNA editing enzyme YbaK/EbsC (Cys-tRNA(Pro) deacylase)